MKQKDIALILVMVGIGAVVAIVVSHFLFASPKSRNLTAEKVDPITADFSSPPPKYFNSNSNNPTQLIQIGGNPNPNPFNNSSH